MLQNEISGSVLTYYNIISCMTDDTATLSICFRNGCKTVAVELYRSLFGYGLTITILPVCDTCQLWSANNLCCHWMSQIDGNFTVPEHHRPAT